MPLSKCSQQSQAGHRKGLFATPPHPCTEQTGIFTTGLLTVGPWLMRQLDRPPLSMRPLLTLWSWAGRSCWAKRVREWEGRSFYGGETGPGLPSAVTLFQGRYHFSPSHPLKIAATLQRQRQSRQDAARAFIFKCSLWPSKSNDADVLMDALPKIKDSLACCLDLGPSWTANKKRWILNFMHLYSTFHRRQLFGDYSGSPIQDKLGQSGKKNKTKHPSSTNTRKVMC